MTWARKLGQEQIHHQALCVSTACYSIVNDPPFLPQPVRTYIVEDNATIRENLIATLEELGGIAPVGFAETEQQGSEWLTGHDGQWDLAIVDLFLKQGSGLGVLQACRERPADQKVVVLTNYATPDIRARCRQLGVDAVFDKSHEIEALIEFCLSLRGSTH